MWLWEVHDLTDLALGEIRPRARRFTLTSKGPGSADFTYNLSEVPDTIPPATAFLERDLTISDGARYIWRGQILATPSLTITPNGGAVTFSAAGIAELLTDRYIPAGTLKEAVEGTTIAWELIDAAQSVPGGGLGIQQGRLEPTVARTKQWDSLTPIRQAIDELATMDNGFDWAIEPDPVSGAPTFNTYAPRRGRDRDLVLETGRNIAGVSAALNGGAGGGVVNVVHSVGANGAVVVVSDPDSVARHRMREAVTVSGEIDDASVLGDRAVGALDPPTWTARLTTITGSVTLDDVEPGDTINIGIREGWMTYDGLARVEEITVTYPGDGDLERLEIAVALT